MAHIILINHLFWPFGRTWSTIGSIFRYAIATARAKSDPTLPLKGALISPTVTPRAAITEPKAFGGLLRAIDSFDGQPGILVALQPMALLFPRPGELRTAERPISDGTLNAALRRLGYRKEEVMPHGFRATASSLLNECGKWHPDAIERQLAHVENNDVRRAYARHLPAGIAGAVAGDALHRLHKFVVENPAKLDPGQRSQLDAAILDFQRLDLFSPM